MAKTMKELSAKDPHFRGLLVLARASARRLFKAKEALRAEQKRYRQSHDAVTAYFKASRARPRKGLNRPIEKFLTDPFED